MQIFFSLLKFNFKKYGTFYVLKQALKVNEKDKMKCLIHDTDLLKSVVELTRNEESRHT